MQQGCASAGGNGEERVGVSGPYSVQGEKKGPPPRLQGIEVEVKYRKTDTFSFPHLEAKTEFLAKLHFLFPPC